MSKHLYDSHIVWQGTTAGGYRHYSRDHTALAPPAREELALSADPTFRGDPARTNPEQLLLMAASSCQLLSFLAVASKAGIDVRDYTDAASATLDTAVSPARISAIRLALSIHVAGGTDHDDVRQAVASAHDECYIANTLNCPVDIDVTVVDA